MNTPLRFRDAAERVLTTAVETLIAFIVTTPFDGPAWWKAFAMAAIYAGVNAVKILATLWVPRLTVWWQDLAYRAASTFVVSILGFLAGAEWLDIVSGGWWRNVAYASGVTALAIIKGGIARGRAGTITPASLAPIA